MTEVPTGTVTFLFTDIESSTTLAQQYPDALPGLLARHHALLHAAIEAHHGHVFRISGDAFCAAFDTASDALQAALDAQRGLQQEVWQPTAIKVRMGIHTGAATLGDLGAGADSYPGYLTLTRVQRIMSTAHGGQVLLSNSTAELVRGQLPANVTLRAMGEHRLKGLVNLEHLWQLVTPDLRSDFPPLNSLNAVPNNLPVQLTRFVGREKAIAAVLSLLDTTRLLTLTGSGGAGKTRLSLQVGMECLNQFSSGVWFVELAPVADPALIPQTLLSIFNLQADNQRNALEVLIDYARAKTLLIVLDNCEHLIDACAQVSASLLQACAGMKILASSREAMGVAGEVAYRVPSLDTPDPAHLPSLAELEKSDAIRLFIERAATAKPGFTLTADNAPALAQICFRLDGIPLAIELAAARLKVLSPEQIAARLDDRFRLLTGGSRTAVPRQQTLRAVIDWSYSLLSEQEKTLFRRLAVFVGGWTLEAAESICGEESGEFDVLDLLTRLVDKSLVYVDESRGEIRYHRLETIRQYSRDKFLETDEVEAVRDRHLDFFVRFAELVDEHLKGRHQVVWQNRMSAEQDNVRVALEWGLSRDPDSALRIVGAANLFWTAGGYSAEGFRWTQAALEQVEKTPLPKGLTREQRRLARAKALCGLTRLYLSLGDNVNAKRVAEDSVAVYRQSQDRRGLSFALVVLAYPLEFLGERAQAEAVLRESNAIARAEGDVYVICRSLNILARVLVEGQRDLDVSQRYVEESYHLAKEAGLGSQEAQASEILGSIAMQRHAYDEARSHFRESLRVYQEIGATFNVILEKSNLAHLERQLSNYAAALHYYRETIVAFRDIAQIGAVAHQLECIGFTALAQHQNERALQLFGAANALREKSGTPMTPDEQIYFDEQLKGLHAELNSIEIDSAWSKGRALTMERAIEFALGEKA